MNKPEKTFELRLHPRATETVSLKIPTDTVESLKKVVASRDMSLDALLKFYIGQGLRQDIAKVFGSRLSHYSDLHQAPTRTRAALRVTRFRKVWYNSISSDLCQKRTTKPYRCL